MKRNEWVMMIHSVRSILTGILCMTGIHIYWASKEYCEKDTVKKINRLADGSYMVIVDTIRSCAVDVVDRQ